MDRRQSSCRILRSWWRWKSLESPSFSIWKLHKRLLKNRFYFIESLQRIDCVSIWVRWNYAIQVVCVTPVRQSLLLWNWNPNQKCSKFNLQSRFLSEVNNFTYLVDLWALSPTLPVSYRFLVVHSLTSLWHICRCDISLPRNRAVN